MPPQTCDREISADLLGKKEARKKREKGEKWRKKEGKLKIEVGKATNAKIREAPGYAP